MLEALLVGLALPLLLDWHSTRGPTPGLHHCIPLERDREQQHAVCMSRMCIAESCMIESLLPVRLLAAPSTHTHRASSRPGRAMAVSLQPFGLRLLLLLIQTAQRHSLPYS